MKSSANRAWRMLVSLSAFLVMGLCTTGFALADHDAPVVNPHVSGHLPDDPGLNPGRPDIIVLPPDDNQPDPDPDPDPDTEPDPEPGTGAPVIILKPGQDPAEIDADGRFTGDATFEQKSLGDNKIVYIISGRTLDEFGNPVPGAQVGFVLDVYSEAEVTRSIAEGGCVVREKFFIPGVQGFSDRNGDYRLRLTYYDEPGARRDGYLAARREGYRAVEMQALALNATELTGQDMELAQGTTASGRCVDRYGRPVAGVEVSGYTGQHSGWAVTDEDGRFSIGGLGEGTAGFYFYSETHYYSDGEFSIELNEGETRELGADVVLATRTYGVVVIDFPAEVGDEWMDGEIRIEDADGAAVYTSWFSVVEEDGRYIARINLEGLEEGGFNAKISVTGEKYWEGELWINARQGELNELGTVYLRESEGPPPRPIEPCRIKPCG